MSLLTRFEPSRNYLNPWKELEDMERRLAAYFRQPLKTDKGEKEAIKVSQWSPLVDISEDDKEYVVKAELPGFKKEDVKLSVEDHVVSISGERKFEKEEKGERYHRIERAYGHFMRSFALPEDADAGKVSAEYKDGVLTVHIPKSAKAQPKSIEVKVT